MADRRGGKRDPGPRQPASGPGAYSSRTDGQTIVAPDLDRPDMQSGDVGMIRDAQAAVPLPSRQTPTGAGTGGVGAPAPPLPPLEALRGGGGLPDFLTGDTTRPEEPMTVGSPFGPGPGPEALMTPSFVEDDYEALLEYFATNYNDKDAVEALNEIRGGAVGVPSPITAPIAAPTAPIEDDEFDETEALDAGEGDGFSDMDFEEDLGPDMPPEDEGGAIDPEQVDPDAPIDAAPEDVVAEDAPAEETVAEDE